MRAQAALLLRGPFGRLVAARTTSMFGSGLGPVALAFGILALPHATPTELSVVQAAYLLPLVLFVLFAGAIADRRPRLRLVVLADLAGGLSWTGLAVLIGSGHAPVLALVGLALVAGAGIALMGPTMSGVVPELAPAGLLQEANALLRLGLNAARVLGLAVAGVLVATVGAGWALGINAASFFISAALVASLGPGAPVEPTGTRLLADLRDGAREFFSRQWLWVVVAQFSLIVAVMQASFGVLGPVIMTENFDGAPSWSAVVVADALGTIAGAGVAMRLRPRRPLLVATLATLLYAGPLLLLGLPVPLVAIVVAAFVSGVGVDVFSVLWETTVQREIPPRLLSRVSSYDWLGSVSLAPIGIAVAGPLAIAVGARTAELGCAALALVATALALMSPQVRRPFEAARSAAEEPARL